MASHAQTKLPFRAERPYWSKLSARILIIVSAIAAYSLIFYYLQPSIGNIVAACAFIVIILGGVLFGLWGGLAASVIIFFLTISISYLTGRGTYFGDLTNGQLAAFLVISVGGMIVGRLRDLSLRLEQELAQRRRVERALRNSEAVFQSLVETVPQNIFRKDLAGRITFANERYCNLMGKSLPEMLGLTDYELYPREVAEKYRQEDLQVIASGNTLEIEEEIIGSDGKTFFQHFIKNPVLDANGHINGVQGIFWDITERKQMEAAEREQRIMAEALRDTAATLNSTLQFDKLLDKILDNVGRVVPHDAANIMLIQDGMVQIASCQGYERYVSEQAVKALRFSIQDTPSLRWMAETGNPLTVSDTKADVRWINTPETNWIRSYAGAPIHIRGVAAGFLNLDSATPAFFTPGHAERLQVFADQAASAIENARLFGDVQRYARQASLLNSITHSAISAPDLQEMLANLSTQLADLIGADGGIISLWDKQQNLPVFEAATGQMEDFQDHIEIRTGEPSLTQIVLESGLVLAIDDLDDSPLIKKQISTALPVRSIVGVPLVADGVKLGAAFIGFKEIHHFVQEEKALLERASDQIALAIAKAQLLEAERQRTAQLTRANSLIMALGHVAARIETAPDPDQVMQSLGEELKKLEVHCLIALRPAGYISNGGANSHADREGLVVRYFSIEPRNIRLLERLTGVKVKDYRAIPENFSYYDEVINKRQPVFAVDPIPMVTAAMPELPPKLSTRLARSIGFKEATKSFYLPLIAEEEVIGTLWMWGEYLDQNDLPAASVFASQVAVALENARLYTRVQQLAITDEVTGLYNRRGLFELGRREVERAARFNRPLCALMIDIDHFKQVNDLYGHPLGDRVLHRLAECLRMNVRDIDIVGRYGGEEFLILLPENDLQAARLVAERLRRAVAELSIPHKSGDICITISVGVAAALPETRDLNALIEHADQAMYFAKQSGRNRVAVM
jgi:diguanylate cyclase (GGDEF)-like protein/PAS domain S-box-containing protein